MIKYVCMVTLGVLSGGTLIKPDSPKTDGGREIRPSSTIEISGLKSHPTYMVTTLCRVVTPYDMFMISRSHDMLNAHGIFFRYVMLCLRELQVYEDSILKKIYVYAQLF